MRGRRPSCCAKSSTSLRMRWNSSSSAYAPPYTPEIERITARWRPNTCFHRVGDLADGRPGARSPRPRARAGCRRRRRPSVSASSAAATLLGIALGLDAFEPRDLLAAHFGVVDLRARRSAASSARRYLFTPTIVSSPRSTAAWRRAAASSMRSFGMPDSTALVMPPSAVDLFDQLPRGVGEALRERLDVVRTAERIDHMGDARLLGEDQLRVARDARRELGRQRDRLVERVRVQALRAAEHRGQRLVRGAHDVVVRVLLGERHARRLAVRAQHQRSGLLRTFAPHDARPQQPRRRAASRPP